MPVKKCPSLGPTILGIDVSHHNGLIDWNLVKASGVKFAYLKATEGDSVLDKMYESNRERAKANGILVGAYHFFHPKHSPGQQATFFMDTVKSCEGELPPVLDWETTDNVPQRDDVLNAQMFLHLVETRFSKPPLIYSSPYFLDALRLHNGFAKYPLWIAHYGVGAPLIPYPWTNWTIWQRTEHGSIRGLPGINTDVDTFNGTFEQLKALV
jgi:lysozyme